MPSEATSRCPICDTRVNVNAGSPTPAHQADGAATQCNGTGKPSH